jgi:hypothetical protein
MMAAKITALQITPPHISDVVSTEIPARHGSGATVAKGQVDPIKVLERMIKDLKAEHSSDFRVTWTLMHWAAHVGDVEAIKVLKEMGGDVSSKLDYG